MTTAELIKIIENMNWLTATVIIITVLSILFWKKIYMKIGDITGLYTPKGGINFLQNQGKQPTGLPANNALKDYFKNTDPLIQKRAKNLEKEVKALLVGSQSEKEYLLILELAKSNFREEYMFVYSSIYGTQLDALLAAEKGGIILTQFYEQHEERTKKIPSYKPSKKTWRYYLDRHSLVEDKEGKTVLTDNGQLFLQYIRLRGLTLAKDY